MAENITWGNLINTTVTGTTLEKTSGASDTPNASALSVQSLTGDGDFTFRINATTSQVRVGLGTDPTSDQNLSHAFAFNTTSGFEIRELGNYKTESTWTPTDVFKLNIAGTVVKYYKNATLIYTSTLALTLPTKLDVVIWTLGAQVLNAQIESAGASNVAPTVNAGSDQTLASGVVANLSGTASDDGLPSGSTLTTTWSKVSGPGTVTFGNANALSTTATFSSDGTYVIRLTATDGTLSSTDDVTIISGSASPSNRIIKVCASGGDYNNSQLQAAMDAALPGDTILLQRGFTYLCDNGPFLMKAKPGATTYVEMRTGVEADGTLIPENEFPAAGVRLTPAYSPVLAKLKVVFNNDAALQTKWNEKVEYWKIRRLEFNPNSYGGDTLIRIGWDGVLDTVNGFGQSVANIPAHFVFDHIYLKGDVLTGQFRGISNHGNDVTVTNSYAEDIKSVMEGQVIWMNSCNGPFLIENNYLSGGCETFMTGGSGTPYVDCTVQASPAPTFTSVSAVTTCRLTTVQDLAVGQGAYVATASGTEYAEVQSISGLDVVFAPGLTAAPTVGGTVRWGVVVNNGVVRHNVFTRPASWRTDPEIGQVGNLTATVVAGSLAAGTYYFRVVAYRTTARGAFLASGHTVVSAVIPTGSTGNINLTWTAPTTAGGVTKYRVYGLTQTEPRSYWEFNAPATSFSYTGQAATGTITTVPYVESGQRVPHATNGRGWFVKNTFELKQGKGIVIEGNVIENSWIDGQTGPLVVFTGTTQVGINPSAHLRNITLRYNIIRNGAQLLQIAGRDAVNNPSGRAKDFNIHDNLCYDLGGVHGQNNLIIVVAGAHNSYNPDRAPENVTINHNTIAGTGHNSVLMLDQYRSSQYQPTPNFIVTNNICQIGNYGLAGLGESGFQQGLWAPFAGPGSLWSQNVIAGANASIHPTGTLAPSVSDLNSLHYTDPTIDNYVLKSTSAYKNAGTDSKDLGADIAAVTAMTNIALSGNNSDAEFELPNSASGPSPADGATNVSRTPNLTWVAGSATTSHTVRFGTDPNPPVIGSQTGTSYAPGTLDYETTYYWRVDEVNARGTATGPVWSFTTAAPAPANVPPTVSISSPANGATFTAGDTITIAASATDGDGTVDRVEFYNGSTLLSTDSSSPYGYSITNAAAGTYVLTAVAIDNEGANATSNVVTVTVSAVSVTPSRRVRLRGSASRRVKL